MNDVVGSTDVNIIVIGGTGLANEIKDILSIANSRLSTIVTTNEEIHQLLNEIEDTNVFLINADNLVEGFKFAAHAATNNEVVCFLKPFFFSEQEKELDLAKIISEYNKQ